MRTPIPLFDLYGETKQYDSPGFVHVENIADRGRENSWKIAPHRHGNMLQFLIIYSGDTVIQIDENQHKMSGSWATAIPPGVVHGFDFQPDTEGKVLTIAQPVLNQESLKECEPYFKPILDQPRIIELDPDGVLYGQLTSYIALIETELERTDSGHQLMLEWQVRMLIMTLRRVVDLSNFQTLSGIGNSDILGKFRDLIELHFREHWTVQHYAKALHTSHSTLNRVCNETIGSPAKEIILNRIITAAKRHLIYTRESLDQIAYRLGYKDPAYFSRIFKQRVSLSPKAYRELKYTEFKTDNGHR